MKKQILKTAIFVAALTASLAVFADPTLVISDGAVTVGPITGANGSVVYVNGGFDAAWSLVITAGTTKPLFGSGVSPNMELSVQATSLGATPVQNLTVIFSDTDFGPVSGQFSSLLVGQPFNGLGGTVTFSTYYDAANQVLALTSPLTSSGPLQPDGSSQYNYFNQGESISGAPFSLSQVVTISGLPASSYSLNANLQALDLACAGGIGQVGVPYSSALVASGGNTPYTFSIISGSLPPGLTLNPTNGVISGTPTTAGTFPYVAQVVDASGRTTDTTILGCGITITPPPLGLLCAGGTGQVGAPYSSALVASGGTAPYTLSIISGSLPPGLTLDTTTGAITGTPTTAGTFPYVAQVVDAAGRTADSTVLNCGIIISPCSGQIGDFVWYDANRNGCQDAGEPGIQIGRASVYGKAVD